MTTGTSIADMTLSGTIPTGGYVPFVVSVTGGGFSDLLNYRYDLGTALSLKVSKSSTGGVVIVGQIGSGIRPEGQLVLQNEVTSPGHTILSLYNVIANEEAAIESVGVLSNGAIQQQGAEFWRWVDGDNSPGAYEVVWARHLVRNGQDNTPIEVWGRNAVRVCRGDTANQSWNDPPPENTFEVYTFARIGSYLNIGPNILYDPSNTETIRLSVEGGIEAGEVPTAGSGAGTMRYGFQAGWSDANDETYVQSRDTVAETFQKIGLYGSEIRIGDAGQKVGFGGVTPILPPTITGNLSGTLSELQAIVGQMLIALSTVDGSGRGILTNSTTS